MTATLAYVLIVYFAPILKEKFFEKLTGQKRPDDGFELEALIRKKEALLRGEETKYSSQNSKKKITTAAKESRTVSFYRSEIQKLAESDPKVNDFQDVLKVIENLEWGEGSHLNQIYTKVSGHLSYRLNSNLITPKLKGIIKDDFLIKIRPAKLPQFKEVINLFQSKTYLEVLLTELNNGGGSYTKQLSLKSNISEDVLLMAISSIFYSLAKPSATKIIEKLFKSQSPLQYFKQLNTDEISNSLTSLIFNKESQNFKTISQIEKLFLEQANLLDSLFPLTPLKHKNDLSGAIEIFRLQKKPTIENVKKSYKELAKLKHPDRLSSKGISDELLQIATDNFSIIQDAYEVLLNEVKE